MNVAGIIAEYNPFHNGHKYQLEQTRELTEADYVIIAMSGDFVQRGEPAIYNKYLRTQAALRSGADLVLEIPVFGSLASAEDFARCGVSLLSRTGVVTHLGFGSESGNLGQLEEQSALYDRETGEISERIRAGLKSGLSWPRARAAAFEAAGASGAQAPAAGHSLPASPNDILACEYIRAIRRLNAPIQPVTIKRTDPGYHSKERSGSFASATAARRAIAENDSDFLKRVLPEVFLSCLEHESCPPVYADDFSMLMNDRLLSASLEEIAGASGMPDDLAAKLFRNRNRFLPVSGLVPASKDRQYTYARVARCLMSLTLGITKEETAAFKAMDSAPWLRILGFRAEAAPLLTRLKKCAQAPVITKTAGVSRLLTPEAARLFELHVLAADRYRMAAELKTGRSMKNEYTRSVLIEGTASS